MSDAGRERTLYYNALPSAFSSRDCFAKNLSISSRSSGSAIPVSNSSLFDFSLSSNCTMRQIDGRLHFFVGADMNLTAVSVELIDAFGFPRLERAPSGQLVDMGSQALPRILMGCLRVAICEPTIHYPIIRAQYCCNISSDQGAVFRHDY